MIRYVTKKNKTLEVLLETLKDKISQAEEFELMMSQQFRDMQASEAEKEDSSTKAAADIAICSQTGGDRSREPMEVAECAPVEALPFSGMKSQQSKRLVAQLISR